MDYDDILEIKGLLKKAIKTQDWEFIVEALDFIDDFVEDDDGLEDPNQ